jgi:hypothetical protein
VASAEGLRVLPEGPLLRAAAFALLLLAGGALWGGARTFEVVRVASEWTTGTKVPRVCSFQAQTGYPCMGCGGTRAFVLAARGDLARAARRNPLGAWAAVSAWLLALASCLTLLAGFRRPLVWTMCAVLVSLPLALFWRAVSWWMSLPAGSLWLR